MQEFETDQSHAGQRADIFVASKYPKFTRSSLEALFDQNMVQINGRPAKPSQRIKHGDQVVVDQLLLANEPPAIKLPVIYEDGDVIVINKPEGILTHSKGALNLEATVASFILPRLDSSLPESNRAGIVHRLDRGTSGVIICAKNQQALTALQRQFSRRKVKKLYEAVVEGIPDPAEAVIEVPLARDPANPHTFHPDPNGKKALTKYWVTKSFSKAGKTYSLLRLQPETGRTHQLRVHLKYIHHPIVGDAMYGHRGDQLLLHAASLEITLPGGDRKVFSAPTPKRIIDFIDD